MRPRASILAGNSSLIFFIATYTQRMLFMFFAEPISCFFGARYIYQGRLDDGMRNETMSAQYREMLGRNLDHMIEKELDDPGYYGPKIRELSDRLGC